MVSSLRTSCECFEPTCFLELRVTAGSVSLDAILTIPDAPPGSTASGSAAAAVSAVTAAATTLASSPPASLTAAIGVQVVSAAPIVVQAAVAVPLAVAPPLPAPPPLPPALATLPSPSPPTSPSAQYPDASAAESGGGMAALVVFLTLLSLLVGAAGGYKLAMRQHPKQQLGAALPAAAALPRPAKIQPVVSDPTNGSADGHEAIPARAAAAEGDNEAEDAELSAIDEMVMLCGLQLDSRMLRDIGRSRDRACAERRTHATPSPVLGASRLSLTRGSTTNIGTRLEALPRNELGVLLSSRGLGHSPCPPGMMPTSNPRRSRDPDIALVDEHAPLPCVREAPPTTRHPSKRVSLQHGHTGAQPSSAEPRLGMATETAASTGASLHLQASSGSGTITPDGEGTVLSLAPLCATGGSGPQDAPRGRFLKLARQASGNLLGAPAAEALFGTPKPDQRDDSSAAPWVAADSPFSDAHLRV